jgi:hypothetical protein
MDTPLLHQRTRVHCHNDRQSGGRGMADCFRRQTTGDWRGRHAQEMKTYCLLSSAGAEDTHRRQPHEARLPQDACRRKRASTGDCAGDENLLSDKQPEFDHRIYSGIVAGNLLSARLCRRPLMGNKQPDSSFGLSSLAVSLIAAGRGYSPFSIRSGGRIEASPAVSAIHRCAEWLSPPSIVVVRPL